MQEDKTVCDPCEQSKGTKHFETRKVTKHFETSKLFYSDSRTISVSVSKYLAASLVHQPPLVAKRIFEWQDGTASGTTSRATIG